MPQKLSTDSAPTPYAMAMFARAAAWTDGNSFYGACNLRAYKRALAHLAPAKPNDLDLAVQYIPEAEHAAAILEGLGLDPNAIAAIVMGGPNSSRLDKSPRVTPATAERALAETCVSVLGGDPNRIDRLITLIRKRATLPPHA